MPLGSRLKAAEQRLATIIDARAPGLDGVTVSRGHPGEHLTREHVWIDHVQFGERSKSLAGTTNPRRQDLTVTIIARIVQEGDDSAAIRDRAYDVADEVEEALRAEPNLNGAVEFGGVTSADADSFTDIDGRVCAVEITATYVARKGS